MLWQHSLSQRNHMRYDTLPSPGIFTNSIKLRQELAKTISAVEIAAGYAVGGKPSEANKLDAFLVAARAAISTFLDAVLPTVVSRVRTAANTAVVTMSETLASSTSVPLTSIVFTPARTVTAIVVDGTTITVTATGVIATDTITYTPPTNGQAHLGVQDLAGNFVATFTGVLA